MVGTRMACFAVVDDDVASVPDVGKCVTTAMMDDDDNTSAACRRAGSEARFATGLPSSDSDESDSM